MRQRLRICALAILVSTLCAVAAGPASACTSIMVGRAASVDGSVSTSHTCDSRIDRTWFDIVEPATHPAGALAPVFTGLRFVTDPGDYARLEPSGSVPQVPETRGYINTSYPCMNDRQVAIGESTFGGRKELRNTGALFPCEELCRFALERASTARGAIAVIDELTREYGYNDGGECLTIADGNEVWHLEIAGCGSDCIGAVWAAVRIPDDHVGVSANASRIMELDLDDAERCLASDNVLDVAIDRGWWDPASGEPFRFCYAYDPEGRTSMGSRRREWRVLDLLAPSLGLDPNAENYPFSVKPDTLVDLATLMSIFRDTFEGTEYDMTKFMYYEKKPGVFEKSPYANPFMHYDMMPLFKINGGWDRMGERCIARYYCTYVTITQSRSWLPDPVGGVVWLGWDNPAMTAFAPIYCGITDVPASWKIDGRKRFGRDCAWWAFNRVADLSAQKWQHMRVDVDSVQSAFETKVFADRAALEKEAARLCAKSPEKARRYLTDYVVDYCGRITEAWWELGDALWVKYTGKF
ncbi:MAG: C69 family dipeptidase [Candidatus Krumholzibacteriota bacterium]|nr:C69 family dipeptidase [Candidatus Krumholzibacteriota bacterium]